MPLIALGVIIILAGFAFGLLIAVVHVLWLSLPVIGFTVAGVAAASKLPRLFAPRWATLRESLTPTGPLDALHWRIARVERPERDWKLAGYVFGGYALFKAISAVDGFGLTRGVRFHFFSSESTVDSELVVVGMGIFGALAGILTIGRLRWRLTTDEVIDLAERRFGFGPRAPILTTEQSSTLLGLERVLREQGPFKEPAVVSNPLVELLTRHARDSDSGSALRDPVAIDGIVRHVETWARREAEATHRLEVLSRRLGAHHPSTLKHLTMVLDGNGRGLPLEDIADEVEDIVQTADTSGSLPLIDAAIDEFGARLRAAQNATGNKVSP